MVDKIVCSYLVECDGGRDHSGCVGKCSGECKFACRWIVSDVYLRRQKQAK